MLRAKVALNLLSLAKLLPKFWSGDWKHLNLACETLHAIFPDKTFRSGDDVYEYEAKNFWSNHEILEPACVFRPTSPEDVATAVLASSLTSSQFAVRGGGHMGIKVT